MKVKDLLKILNDLPIKNLEAEIEVFACGDSYSVDYAEMMQSDSTHKSEYLSIGANLIR